MKIFRSQTMFAIALTLRHAEESVVYNRRRLGLSNRRFSSPFRTRIASRIESRNSPDHL
jgi:hypothetical protein